MNIHWTFIDQVFECSPGPPGLDLTPTPTMMCLGDGHDSDGYCATMSDDPECSAMICGDP